MDNFKEQLVTTTNKTAYNASKIFMGIFGVLAFFFFVTANLIFGLFFAVGCGLLFYFKRLLYLEYEYSITNGEVDVDKIMEMKSRKRIITFNMKDAELVAPVDSDVYKDFGNKPSEIIKAVPTGNTDRVYAAIITGGAKRAQLLFVPNEDIINLCFLYNPKAVKKNL